MNLKLFIFFLLFLQTLFADCNGFNWFGSINELDCNRNDLEIINRIVLQSKKTIDWDMDINFDGNIDPLEVGWQFWEDGRLIHWICSDVPSPWYVYNYNCGLSGELPNDLLGLNRLEKLHFDNNNFYGTFPEKICDMRISNKSNYWFRISNNNLCPPFPICIEENNLIQDSSECYERK